MQKADFVSVVSVAQLVTLCAFVVADCRQL